MTLASDTIQVLTLLRERGRITCYDTREAGIKTKNLSVIITRIEKGGVAIDRRELNGKNRVIEYSLSNFKRTGRVAG